MDFKAGDKVEVVNAGMPSGILKVGVTYTISRIRNDGGVVLTWHEGLWFFPSRFRLVETQTPEIGDTVEVTVTEGTTVRGVVTAVGALGGLTFAGAGDIFVPVNSTTSVTIIKKAEKPKVWAVGDDIAGSDYASETIKNGTLVGTPGDSLIKSEDGWIDCRTGENYQHSNLHAPRTIVYIP